MVYFVGCCHPKAYPNRHRGPELSRGRMLKAWASMRGRPILDNHQRHRQVGAILDAWMDGEDQLWIRAHVDESTEMGLQVAKLITSGIYKGLSLGMDHGVVEKSGRRGKGGSVLSLLPQDEFDWSDVEDVVWSEITEVSVCPEGKYPNTTIHTWFSASCSNDTAIVSESESTNTGCVYISILPDQEAAPNPSSSSSPSSLFPSWKDQASKIFSGRQWFGTKSHQLWTNRFSKSHNFLSAREFPSRFHTTSTTNQTTENCWVSKQQQLNPNNNNNKNNTNSTNNNEDSVTTTTAKSVEKTMSDQASSSSSVPATSVGTPATPSSVGSQQQQQSLAPPTTTTTGQGSTQGSVPPAMQQQQQPAAGSSVSSPSTSSSSVTGSARNVPVPLPRHSDGRFAPYLNKEQNDCSRGGGQTSQKNGAVFSNHLRKECLFLFCIV